MALIRILVDGYSLLHAWPDLAPGKARHSEAARKELIDRLTQYRDAIGTPISIFFDGYGAPAGVPKSESTPELEVLFSKAGQTADDMIERVAFRLREFGEVLVVTNDMAERDMVGSMGVMLSSCFHFITSVENTLGEMHQDIQNYNRKELNRFKKQRGSK